MHDDARIYDLEVGGFERDIPFWTGLLEERQARNVLDLACGTGRITFPLAARGRDLFPDFGIVGLDVSRPLLARARERLAEEPAGVRSAIRFVEGDMADFDLGERFDLIVVGFNSLMYVRELEGQLSCLKAVRRHLAPGGAFGLDVLMPTLAYLAEAERVPAVRLEIDLAAPEQGIKRFLRFATERYDAVTQADASTYFYEITGMDGSQERRTDDLVWHMYYPRELELLLRTAGLCPVAKYGGFERQPFDRRAKQMLWVAEAR
jgi:SAM-dependent methyltransferase